MKADCGLTIERMGERGRVSRSGFYPFDDGELSPDRDMELSNAIQKIAVEWPSYGGLGIGFPVGRSPELIRRQIWTKKSGQTGQLPQDLPGLVFTQSFLLYSGHRIVLSPDLPWGLLSASLSQKEAET